MTIDTLPLAIAVVGFLVICALIGNAIADAIERRGR